MSVECQAEVCGFDGETSVEREGKRRLRLELGGDRGVWGGEENGRQTDGNRDGFDERNRLILYFCGLLSEKDAIISQLNALVEQKESDLDEAWKMLNFERRRFQVALGDLEDKDLKVAELEVQLEDKSQLLELLEEKLDEAMMEVRNLTFSLQEEKHKFKRNVVVEKRIQIVKEEILPCPSDSDSDSGSDSDSDSDTLPDSNTSEKATVATSSEKSPSVDRGKEFADSETSECESIDYGANRTLNPDEKIEYLSNNISRLIRLNWRLAKCAILHKNLDLQPIPPSEMNPNFDHASQHDSFVGEKMNVPKSLHSHGYHNGYQPEFVQPEFLHPQWETCDDNSTQMAHESNATSTHLFSTSFESPYLYQDQFQLQSHNAFHFQHPDQVHPQCELQLQHQSQDEVSHHDQNLVRHHFDCLDQVNIDNRFLKFDLPMDPSPKCSLNTLKVGSRNSPDPELFDLGNVFGGSIAKPFLPLKNCNAKRESRFQKLFSKIYDEDSSQKMSYTNSCFEKKAQENDVLGSDILLPLVLF